MDRNFSGLQKFPESGTTDKKYEIVNTKKYFAYEIEELYTGPEISSSYVYAQIFTMLWAVMTFSSGMPFLYIISALFYGLYYWVYKYLLFNFYRRTTNFNENLPMLSMGYMRAAIIWHLFIGLFIMTNVDIIEGSSQIASDAFQSFTGRGE